MTEEKLKESFTYKIEGSESTIAGIANYMRRREFPIIQYQVGENPLDLSDMKNYIYTGAFTDMIVKNPPPSTSIIMTAECAKRVAKELGYHAKEI